MRKQEPGINQELQNLDKKLASLIYKRSRMLGRLSRSRQTADKSLIDPELEKRLWRNWKKELQGYNPSLVRQIFTLLNSMGYLQAEKSRSEPFSLYPSRRAVDLELFAPLDRQQSLNLVIMAVLGSHSVHLKKLTPNDQLLELVKLANECGGTLAWQGDELSGRGLHGISLDNHSLFIRHSLFNFYLFFCIGLGSPARIKFSGSAILKTFSLRSLQKLAPRLGARLSSIEPQSYSLPAKLEASGEIPAEINLEQDIDPDFIHALILAAPTFPGPVSIGYPQSLDGLVKACSRMLSRCGINAALDPQAGKILVHPGAPEVCTEENVPMDALLSAFLLALAVLGRGRVRLSGIWPGESAEAGCIKDLLSSAGVRLESGRDYILAHKNSSRQDIFDLRNCPRVTPVIFPLVIPEEERPVRILLPPGSEQLEICIDLLSLLGCAYEPEETGMRITGRIKPAEESPVWTSPDPYWSLGYCLLSFKFPGIRLANPESLSSLWPGFWKIFTGMSPKKTQEKDEQTAKSKRRIRLAGY